MPILFIRHGEKKWPNGKRPDGETGHVHDPPLKSDGQLPATLEFVKTKEFVPEIIFSSPFRRCVETVNLFKKGIGKEDVPVLYAPKIGEYLGNMRRGPVDLDPETRKYYTRNQIEFGMSAETVKSVHFRVKRFVEELRKLPPNHNIVIISHNMVIKEMLKHLGEVSPPDVAEGGYIFTQ